MDSIKNLKKKARSVMLKNYWLLLFTCIVVAFFGVELADSLNVFSINQTAIQELIDVSVVINEGNYDQVSEQVFEGLDRTKTNTYTDIFSRNKGVFAGIINSVSNGVMYYKIIQFLNTFSGSSNVSLEILLIVVTIGYVTIWYFFKNTFKVVYRRIFLESRIYKKISINRYVFLLKVKRNIRVAHALFIKLLLLILWSFTVFGLFIKIYSYKLVEFILAENPDIKPLDAIKLSKRMMKGHKWEAFKIDLSFIGWELLALITFGLSKIFISNMYRIATQSEFYVEIRRLAKENNVEKIELLNDKYLYEKVTEDVLDNNYAEIKENVVRNNYAIPKMKGFLVFIENTLGITFESTEANKKFEEEQILKFNHDRYLEILKGEIYPDRLYTLEIQEAKNNLGTINFLKRYSLLTLIILFFLISLVGWIWEVLLIFIQSGVLANRGALNGPWLPIYGYGSLAALMFGYKLRNKPIAEFTLIVVLSGVIEYLTSYILEMKTGLRWWDYTGCFLNINGRICAEGLLAFGIGGLAVVYLIAPVVDNKLKSYSKYYLTVLSILLLIAFSADNIVSRKTPHTGDGITETREENIEKVINSQK